MATLLDIYSSIASSNAIIFLNSPMQIQFVIVFYQNGLSHFFIANLLKQFNALNFYAVIVHSGCALIDRIEISNS